MDQGRPFLGSIRHWVWGRLIRWTGLDVDPLSLTAGERWCVVAITVPAVVRARYLRPVRQGLLTRSPAWVVAMRLQRRPHHWYLIPSRAAAEHVRLRFDFWPIEVGDHVRIVRGRLTAIGCVGQTFSEIIFVEPTGEPEPDPHSAETTRAWAAFWLGRQESASK